MRPDKRMDLIDRADAKEGYALIKELQKQSIDRVVSVCSQKDTIACRC